MESFEGYAELLLKTMFIVLPIFMGVGFIFIILMSVSPKFRGKMMSRQVKSTRYMMEESKDDFAKMGGTAVKIKKQILDENEDDLIDIANKEAKLKSVGIKSAAKAIKEGLTENDSIYCKHCGESIDTDSKFCNKCGKEQ